MRSLITLMPALAGLMMIIIGGMSPAAILFPKTDLTLQITQLPSSLQVSAVLLTSLVCGQKSAVIAIIAYLILGLFYFPVFNGGGSIGYIMTPDFGYLIGFIPATLITSSMLLRKRRNKVISLLYITLIGIAVIHFVGMANVIAGSITQRWDDSLLEILFIYTFSTIPSQIILSPAIALLAKLVRGLTFQL